MLKNYKSVLQLAEAEITEKKSRFIATVKPVRTEEEAKAFIEELRKKYWDASHNVFAYQIGERNEIQRFSDDGEPSGTAGMPVLNVLKGEEIKNTVVVVTRYFGGTLLGTGGLVRAYGHSAKEGIIAARIIEKVLYQKLSIIVSYTQVGKIQYETHQAGHIIHDTLYTDQVEFVVLVKVDEVEKYIKIIKEATSGQGIVKEGKEIYGSFVDQDLLLTDC
ncbi:YigZ family protein [Vallitalea okinawensis]|uniref:YigZ family protein n=1 Tax=Vallitalea okinawensis TaxID=2078660 RepID=UPI000CFDA58E|nr:YigZ family protein [Vallitalea okinawensis]